MKLLILCILGSLILNSCGELNGAEEENDCGLRYVSGKECIVCSKGGVSCNWN